MKSGGLPLLGGVFLLSLGVRLGFAIAVPAASGDWVLYRAVARGIAQGCGVALPGEDGCSPHFGGNHLPLFPAFVAGVWWLFGVSDPAVRVCQSLIAAAANTWLAAAVLRATGSRPQALAVGLLVSLSAVQAYWAAALLTETLALAATGWVWAELLLGLRAGRLRVPGLAAALVAASWARLDGILLLAPVLAACAMMPRPVVRRLVLVLALVALPLGAWSLRNLAVGVDPLPAASIRPDGRPGPPGYTAWVMGWVVTEGQLGRALNFDVTEYDRIRIDPAIQRDPAAADLLGRLQAAAGQPFPPDVDAGFAALDRARRAAETPIDRVRRDLARAWGLAAEWVWPFAAPPGDADVRVTPTDFWRFALLAAALAAAAWGWATGDRLIRRVAQLAGLYALLRLGFFAVTGNVEQRYLVEIAPGLELLAGLFLGAVWTAARRERH